MSHRAGLDQVSVVEAAVRLIDEEGLDQLSLGRLAERLGVRTPSLYNHIAGLPGLMRDLALYSLRDLYEHITRATIGKAGGEAILALADSFRAYAKEAPGRYALTQQAPDFNDPEVQAAAQRVVGVAQAVLAAYNLREEDAIHAIRGLRSIVHGFLSLENEGGFKMAVDTEASFHWLLNLFIAGLP